MRNIMEKMMSKRDVIVCRGIWYVATLLSLFGLYISLNLFWPPGDSSSLSRFLRDGAVSVTTFYAVTLLRYLFFTDPPSTWYKEFTTPRERIPQVVFSEISMYLLFSSPINYVLLTKNKPFSLYVSLFTVSLFTGGIGLIQLSDKFRMEMIHALLTLFFGWLCALFGILGTIDVDNGLALVLAGFLYTFSIWILCYNFP
ncbi:PREDICTED: uncharacterized protein LOC104745623 [Camelina sativa]|uniref:Uncharacterized protein LOC104745622 n=1 Tax=Camelina sativa TaxID=90675 RepID=A0ABM0W3L8_CAMSA|nr:PREDICTED: uncharacterized protein LOC104745622 [Camelina sativa]XP_010465218.1 PREDICTED: uncharacterized protein LOC104745623 [Camelina sativa]